MKCLLLSGVTFLYTSRHRWFLQFLWVTTLEMCWSCVVQHKEHFLFMLRPIDLNVVRAFIWKRPFSAQTFGLFVLETKSISATDNHNTRTLKHAEAVVPVRHSPGSRVKLQSSEGSASNSSWHSSHVLSNKAMKRHIYLCRLWPEHYFFSCLKESKNGPSLHWSHVSLLWFAAGRSNWFKRQFGLRALITPASRINWKGPDSYTLPCWFFLWRPSTWQQTFFSTIALFRFYFLQTML